MIANPFELVDRRLSNIEDLLHGIKFPEPLPESTEGLLTPEEAAKFLKVTSTSLWRMRKAGKIKLYGLGGKRYYRRSELLNSLEEIKA